MIFLRRGISIFSKSLICVHVNISKFSIPPLVAHTMSFHSVSLHQPTGARKLPIGGVAGQDFRRHDVGECFMNYNL